MAEKPAQNYANHRRFVPLYHFVLFAVLVVNLLWTVVQAVRGLSFGSVWNVVMALALLAIYFYMRVFALTVQDRVIRLEMRLRLKQILPEDLRPRIGELTPAQLIGLRFASDAEMAELVREVLTNNIQEREVIKRKVRDWQADHLRC
jgi:low affinity Fe/Cu permease